MDWYKQAPDKPLFPDLLWSRPENRQHAGKLLIIGGNLHSITAPANAYNIAAKAGAGTIRVILPDSLRSSIAKAFPEAEFAPSTPSGSFSKQSLGVWLQEAAWSDAVLLVGDVGRNSETTIALESFLEKYIGLVCITQDCLDQFVPTPLKLFNRPNTTIVASFAQLQKMWHHLNQQEVLVHSNGLLKNIELLHGLGQTYSTNIITKQNDQIIVCAAGKISTTPSQEEIWRVKTASKAVIWWLQNVSKPFEALTSAMT